jgi:hypothetical protein
MNPGDLPLRDLHMPPPVGWWPPAPGWLWVIGLTLAILGLALTIWRARRYRRARLGIWIEPEFRSLTRRYRRDGDAVLLLRSISVLLRRACISIYPRQEVAGLTNERWLALLDRAGGTSEFSQGPGQLLAHGPYLPEVSAEQVEQILSLVGNWVTRCGRQKLREPGP